MLDISINQHRSLLCVGKHHKRYIQPSMQLAQHYLHCGAVCLYVITAQTVSHKLLTNFNQNANIKRISCTE